MFFMTKASSHFVVLRLDNAGECNCLKLPTDSTQRLLPLFYLTPTVQLLLGADFSFWLHFAETGEAGGPLCLGQVNS